jgi:hypothetical protein
VQLYAFDALMLEGNDLRKLPLSMRKANLARLLARRPGGHLRFRIRTGEIGVDLFRKTCEFDLAGLCQSAGTASTAPADRQVDQGQEPPRRSVIASLAATASLRNRIDGPWLL